MIAPALAAQEEITPTISCKAQKDSQLYVSANGNVSPCCWLDLDWVPQMSMSKIDYMMKVKNIPNLHDTSFEEIFDSGHFNKISSCWDKDGLKECSKQCGTFDKLNAQYEKKAYV